jgi:parallel beta-helix repeat protein
MHDAEMYSLGVSEDGDPQGVEIGYYYGAYLLPNIQDSVLSGLSSIGVSHGYRNTFSNINNWEADMFTVKNNKISHYNTANMIESSSHRYEDMCMIVAGSNVHIEGNILRGCDVGVFLQRTPYYYYHNSTYWGADDAVIKDNDFVDTVGLGVWFYLNAQNEGTVISGNTFTGSSSPAYGIYTQDGTTTDLTITGNTISNAENSIYMRGATDWKITDNTINGLGEAAYAGIYVMNGYGEISGNTLTDADGGILIDGVKYGFDVNITDNTIGQTPGRTAPAAVGIWAEDCGSSGINTGGNDISIMENAMVTDGCDLTDTGSTLTALGGSGGEVHTVQQNANAFSPADITINEGDTVRWRSNAYYNNSGTGETHNVVFADGPTSGNMNLGSTWTRTFNTAGSYPYVCGNHAWMTGEVTVETGSSGGGFASVGFNVAGSNDEVTLDGTQVSGFDIAIEQFGGEMTLSGGAALSGGTYAVYAEDTDVTIDGAHLVANADEGSAIYVTGTTTLDATEMDVSGLYGLNSDGIDFRWNGGNSDAGTALMVDGGAEGSVENVTWADATTQIDAGSYVTVTSVGNTLDAAKLILDLQQLSMKETY